MIALSGGLMAPNSEAALHGGQAVSIAISVTIHPAVQIRSEVADFSFKPLANQLEQTGPCLEDGEPSGYLLRASGETTSAPSGAINTADGESNYSVRYGGELLLASGEPSPPRQLEHCIESGSTLSIELNNEAPKESDPAGYPDVLTLILAPT